MSFVDLLTLETPETFIRMGTVLIETDHPADTEVHVVNLTPLLVRPLDPRFASISELLAQVFLSRDDERFCRVLKIGNLGTVFQVAVGCVSVEVLASLTKGVAAGPWRFEGWRRLGC